MDADPGPLIASGRAADVFDLGDGTVLRRYRRDRDTALERRVMDLARESGVPVPRVHDAEGSDLVMDRVEGPTMLEDLGRRPWALIAHARLLADLQATIASVPAPAWLPRRDGVPEGGSLLHLDLHPMNVLIAADGPVVIDWTNAASGDAHFDAAISYVLMSAFEVGGPVDRIGQRLLVGTFASRRGRRPLRSHLDAACTYRLADPNVTAGERAALLRLRGD